MRHHDNDAIWLAALTEAGFMLVRDPAAYVSYDGRGAISVSPDEEMDEDDHLPQILLHELCHHLVEGDASRHAPDWGLDNMSDADRVRELAALRVQAWLADQHGLRALMVATTDFRPYYEALGADPLRDGPDDAVPIALDAAARWQTWALRPIVQRALAATTCPATADPRSRAAQR
jgi:hypothetical protein